MYLEAKHLEKDLPGFQGRQALNNPSVSIVCHNSDNWHGSSGLKWWGLLLSCTTLHYNKCDDSSRGLSSRVGWHLRSNECFAKAFQNLRWLCSFWVVGFIMSAYELSALFLLGEPFPRNHGLSSCCPLTVSSCALFFSHLCCPNPACAASVGCCSASGEITPHFTQIKLIKSWHIFISQECINRL